MIPVQTFIAKVEEIANEDPAYRIGGTGKDGTCDCIGLLVGAIRRAGGAWSCLKGSNYAARHAVHSLLPIVSNADLAVGEAVFKAREPTDPGYDAETIHNRYADSPDQRDYYHIGVVESVYPLRIRHMTTPRVKMDTSLGKWKYHGWLRLIQNNATVQGSENEPMETVTVYGGNGNAPINMRASGSLKSPILCTLPQHATAELLSTEADWCRVKYGTRTGYVQKVFVHSDTETHSESDPGDPEDMIRLPRNKLEAVYDEIGDWLGLRG